MLWWDKNIHKSLRFSFPFFSFFVKKKCPPPPASVARAIILLSENVLTAEAMFLLSGGGGGHWHVGGRGAQSIINLNNTSFAETSCTSHSVLGDVL